MPTWRAKLAIYALGQMSYGSWSVARYTKLVPNADVTQYLDFKVEYVSGLDDSLFDVGATRLNTLFVAALGAMEKISRIWESYLMFVKRKLPEMTTREAFDEALMHLPPLQRDKIHDLYMPFEISPTRDTDDKIWRRCMEILPDDT